MPFIRPYESSVSPTGVVSPRRATAATFGGDSGLRSLGQGLQALGQVVARRELEQDDADYLSAAARLKADLAERRFQASVSGEAAKPEWIDTEREYAQEQLETVTRELRTGPGRRLAGVRTSQLLGAETARWIETQATVTTDLQKNQLQEVEDLTLRAIQKDPASYSDTRDKFLAGLEGPAYSRLSKDLKQDYVREFRTKAARAHLDGIEQTFGPTAALDALDTVRDEIPAAQYTALRDHFTARAAVETAENNEVAQLATFRHIDDIISTGGDPRPLIDRAVESGTLSAEQGIAREGKWREHVEHQRKVADGMAAFRAGNLVAFAQVEPAIRQEVADAWAAEQLRTYGEATPEEKAAVADALVQKGVEMDYLFGGVKASLRAPPASQESFVQAVDLYRSLEAFDPYYAARHVSEDQRARFDVYSLAVQAGGAVEQGIEAATRITPENVSKMRKTLNSAEGRTFRVELAARMKDKPWSTADILNGQQAANTILDRTTILLAGNPALDLETAITKAGEAYEAQNVRMGSLWVPRTFLSGVPADSMGATANRIIGRLPDFLNANNLPVLEGDYALAPDFLSERDGQLQVFDPLGFPVPGLRIGPNDFRQEYRALQADAFAAAVQERQRREASQGPLDLSRGSGLNTGARP